MIKIKVYEMERCQVKVYTIIMELVSPSQTPTQKAKSEKRERVWAFGAGANRSRNFWDR